MSKDNILCKSFIDKILSKKNVDAQKDLDKILQRKCKNRIKNILLSDDDKTTKKTNK